MSEQSTGTPLHILHTINSFRWTGVAEPAVQLAREQKRLGHRITLAVEEGGDLERRAREMGLDVVTGFMTHHSNPWTIWRRTQKFRAYLKELSPDVVHTHILHDHWVAGWALRGCRKTGHDDSRPLLFRTFHREERPRRDALHQWLARQTDGMIAISSSLADRLKEAYNTAKGDLARFMVIGGAVDSEAFRPDGDPERFRREWDIPMDAPVVGLLSRLREARGIFWLLDAVEGIVERVPSAIVVYCGRGRHADLLRERIEAHPLRDNIRYRGYVQPTDLLDAYAAFDVHCLLGPGNDGACRAALQSMACARPLIAVDRGALRDLLTPDETDAELFEKTPPGLLVEQNNVAALAEAVAQYLRNRDACQIAGQKARDYIKQRNQPESQARSVIEFYRERMTKALIGSD